MGKVHASLFSGFGAADLAATWMGWDNAFWCEIDDFPRTVLSYWFPKSKGYGNIKETDFTPWRGKIDILTGGFPCQPFSVAGQRKGQEDDRYLWPEMLRAIREIRPTWIIGENVGGILSMVQPGSEITVESQASLFEASDKETILEQEYVVETVCRNLEQEGYSVQSVVIPACAVGAPHRRDRVFFIAYRTDSGTESMQREGKNRVYQSWNASDSNGQVLQKWLKTRRRTHTAKAGAGLDDGTKRSGRLWYAPYTYNIGLQARIFSEGNGKSRRETSDGYASEYSINSGGTLHPTSWSDFPTQSPVCSRNDGFSSQLDDITFSKWREGSIKGYGNAIVPQVMYEIFKVIETIKQ